MFGLCMPSGETYLVFTDGKCQNIMINDESNPRKFIMNDKDILSWVKSKGYKNIKAIMYTRDGRNTVVNMADYYAEHGQELEG